MAISHVKQLLLACRSYAADNEGFYPPSLQGLYPDYVDVESLFYAEDRRGNRIPVIYHPGYKDTADLHLPLIEYPISYMGKIAVGYTGGHVREVPAE